MEPLRRISVLIADDTPPIRDAVRSLLNQHPRFQVCGEAINGADAVEKAQQLKPEVVVLNITMPVLNGLEAARRIKASRPETAIVILSGHADQHFVQWARDIGVRAYVAKSRAGDALVTAIDAALAEEEFVLID